MNIVGNKHSKYIHILVAKQKRVQLILEIQFSLKSITKTETKKEEYHLSEKVLFIRPYLLIKGVEAKYNFPAEANEYDLRKAYQLMVLLVNSIKIRGFNFISKIEDALEEKNLKKISNWLGKDHSQEQVQEMLSRRLKNPFKKNIRSTRATKTTTANLLITTKGEPFKRQLSKYLQTHISL
ncbi:MAG: hypothetical protein L3J07_03520 [Candidatus Magasanikbacteria bacterium]|nr:hypothetical protein [Candidatus Magasanikbacteria bacterium]